MQRRFLRRAAQTGTRERGEEVKCQVEKSACRHRPSIAVPRAPYGRLPRCIGAIFWERAPYTAARQPGPPARRPARAIRQPQGAARHPTVAPASRAARHPTVARANRAVRAAASFCPPSAPPAPLGLTLTGRHNLSPARTASSLRQRDAPGVCGAAGAAQAPHPGGMSPRRSLRHTLRGVERVRDDASGRTDGRRARLHPARRGQHVPARPPASRSRIRARARLPPPKGEAGRAAAGATAKG